MVQVASEGGVGHGYCQNKGHVMVMPMGTALKIRIRCMESTELRLALP